MVELAGLTRPLLGLARRATLASARVVQSHPRGAIVEPTTSSSRTKRATNCATARFREWILVKNGRAGGIRTRDPLVPNQVRYQLRYGSTFF